MQFEYEFGDTFVSGNLVVRRSSFSHEFGKNPILDYEIRDLTFSTMVMDEEVDITHIILLRYPKIVQKIEEYVWENYNGES